MYTSMNIRVLFCLAGVLALAGWLVGCEPPAPADPQEAEPPSFEAPADEPATARPTTLDVGDVEAQVWVEGTIDPESDDPGIHAQAMVDRRQRRNMVRIQVEPPYPDELWLRYETTCERNFPDPAAVIRGSFVRDVDGAELGRLAGVFGEDGVHTQYTARINALEDLEEIPESFLITFEGESLLLRDGVDANEVDPEEAETSSGRRSDFVYCNPIRVIFLEDDEEEAVEVLPDAEEPPVEPEPEEVEPEDEEPPEEPEQEVTEGSEPETAEEPETEEDPGPETPEETEAEQDEAPEPEQEEDEDAEPADGDNGNEDNGEDTAA